MGADAKDAKLVLGHALRRLREAAGRSQENLAHEANITYQYLSAIENGKENFSIGILDSLANALGVGLARLIQEAYADSSSLAVVAGTNFIPQAPLPPNLSLPILEKVLNETHRTIRLLNTTLFAVSQRPLRAYIQGNNFSGIVSNILCDAFSRLSPYRHNHDQRYPDLVCKDGKDNTVSGLEVKTTIRPGKGGESHNGHSGWHIVACFFVDSKTGDICFAHVMFANLIGHQHANADWKYVGSRINSATGSQRTETYVTTPKGTAKLRHGTVYLDRALIDISRWRTSSEVQAPVYSPFAPH